MFVGVQVSAEKWYQSITVHYNPNECSFRSSPLVGYPQFRELYYPRDLSVHPVEHAKVSVLHLHQVIVPWDELSILLPFFPYLKHLKIPWLGDNLRDNPKTLSCHSLEQLDIIDHHKAVGVLRLFNRTISFPRLTHLYIPGFGLDTLENLPKTLTHLCCYRLLLSSTQPPSGLPTPPPLPNLRVLESLYNAHHLHPLHTLAPRTWNT